MDAPASELARGPAQVLRQVASRRRVATLFTAGLAGLLAAGGGAYSLTRTGEPGPQGNGSTRLINQRTITPAGQ